MKVYINSIAGIDDAIVSMFMSKRTWTRELEMEVRDVCKSVLDRDGRILQHPDAGMYEKFSG